MNKYEKYMNEKKNQQKSAEEGKSRAKEVFDRRLENDFSSIFAFFDAELVKEENNKKNYMDCLHDILEAAGDDKESRDKYLATYSEVISDYDNRIKRIKEEKDKATKLQGDMKNLMQSIEVYKEKVKVAREKVAENQDEDAKEKLEKHEKLVQDTYGKLYNQESEKISKFKSLRDATLVKGDMDALNNDDKVQSNLDAPISPEDKEKIDDADDKLNKKSWKDKVNDFIHREKHPVKRIKTWGDKLKEKANSKPAKAAAVVGLTTIAAVVAALAMGNPAVLSALGAAAEYGVAGSMMKK